MASKTFKALLPLLLICASLVATLALYATRPETATVAPPEKAVLVDVAEVVLQDLRIPIQAQGTVTPHRQTTLASEVSGRIVSVSRSFHAGGFIAAGDVLVEIDDRNYQANLLRAKAGVESAESALAQEIGRAEVAHNEWKKLPKNSQRSQAATDLYLRKPQLEQAQAQLLSAEADFSKAQDDLERTVIRAPYDSLIKEKRADLGQYVGPGTPLAAVFAVDYAEVRLAIPQSKLSYLDLPGVTGFDPGEAPPVDLYTDVAGEVKHWVARLQRTEGVLDERSRVLFVVARVDDPYALTGGNSKPLRIGSFVKASILGSQLHDLVVLPRYVLRAGNMLWVVDEQLTLRNRKVQTLRTGGEEIYVTSGLQQGDLVSLTTISHAIPGISVRINSRTSTLRQQGSFMEAAGVPGADPPASNKAKQQESSAPDQSSAVASSTGTKAA
ncbi:MAG: efflux RND transporter periplasmic adaptor subunit [Gammaproteobacteria bacterium]|nr:efflux RND transporter periplasmic adaptor subunit [Gammaproteobacteria bacterium]